MGMLDHWQPVLASDSLRRSRVVGVRLAGQEMALFRTRTGVVGAVDDCCPHRRMRLSLGNVAGERLQCRYHGWTFGQAGDGASPTVPQLHACVASYETCEEHGYIWVKSKHSTPEFPKFEVDGWYEMCASEHVARAPLELVLDNFTEVEHTPMTHQLFGFELERMKEVTIASSSTEESVGFTSAGPAKRIGLVMRSLLGIGRDDHFHDVWMTRFSPVYSVFDHYWTNPRTGKEARVRWRVYVFLVPIDVHVTRIVTFTYARSTWPVPQGGLPAFRKFARRQVYREINKDIALLEGLASHDTGLRGMKLGRFDRTLVLNRERIARIYRGEHLESEQQLRIRSAD